MTVPFPNASVFHPDWAVNAAPVSEVASRDALVDPAALEPFVAYAGERTVRAS